MFYATAQVILSTCQSEVDTRPSASEKCNTKSQHKVFCMPGLIVTQYLVQKLDCLFVVLCDFFLGTYSGILLKLFCVTFQLKTGLIFVEKFNLILVSIRNFCAYAAHKKVFLKPPAWFDELCLQGIFIFTVKCINLILV